MRSGIKSVFLTIHLTLAYRPLLFEGQYHLRHKNAGTRKRQLSLFRSHSRLGFHQNRVGMQTDDNASEEEALSYDVLDQNSGTAVTPADMGLMMDKRAFLLCYLFVGTFSNLVSSQKEWPPQSFKKAVQEIYREAQLDIIPLRILEIGAGKRIRSVFENRFRAGSEVVALDIRMPEEEVLREAEDYAKNHDYSFRFVQGDAMNLGNFEDGSFDAVGCSLTLCEVPSVAEVVSEVKRVLRPGGRFAFVEHVGVVAEDNQALLGFAQTAMDPLQQFKYHCHLRRNSDQIIVNSFGAASVIRLQRILNNEMFPVSQQVAGVVVKA